jgi:hypothetical protein
MSKVQAYRWPGQGHEECEKTLAPAEYFNYAFLLGSVRSDASRNCFVMRRLAPILRCIGTRCATATRRWFLATLAICIAIAASWKLLVEEHRSPHPSEEYSAGPREESSSADLNEYFAADQSPDTAGLRPSGSFANLDQAEDRGYLPNSRLAPERFNAALAAGLIDPPGIAFTKPIVPALSPAAERAVFVRSPEVTFPNPPRAMESTAPLVTAAGATTASAAANPTKPIDSVSSNLLAMDKIASAPPRQSAAAEPEDRTPAPRPDENHREGSVPTKKSLTVRFVASARNKSPGNSFVRESMSRNNSWANGAKAGSSSDPRSGDHELRSQDVSENLQRFASDFVRANQNDNVWEQHRYFADSVHFYSEGDLSLASVMAATSRHHREERTKRSEVTGPAVASGPVNGGFFVIEQPVRWTQSQGSKVTQGGSVLRLRVVPIDHGTWKITSIDEEQLLRK